MLYFAEHFHRGVKFDHFGGGIAVDTFETVLRVLDLDLAIELLETCIEGFDHCFGRERIDRYMNIKRLQISGRM